MTDQIGPIKYSGGRHLYTLIASSPIKRLILWKALHNNFAWLSPREPDIKCTARWCPARWMEDAGGADMFFVETDSEVLMRSFYTAADAMRCFFGMVGYSEDAVFGSQLAPLSDPVELWL